ncbi:DUF2125 domain-containing protein [Pseudorhodobacter aquimaris]|uniref:DUF2125 domain-containing protein n=1 Tax=Pseudorhodobacter aquimaris TaxID=687412 RepID=UPI00067AA379|nr:DUF2125 domain-containing protein [Pseudorhodobacter aquimaris]
MTSRILTITSISALTAFLALPALADITAEEAWKGWQELGTAHGQTLSTGSQTRAGDTLTITDLTIEVINDDAKVAGVIPEVRFREMGDGRVEVTMSNAYQFEMEGDNGEGDTVGATFNVQQNGATLITSGTPEVMNHDYNADNLRVGVVDVKTKGEPRDIAIDVNLSSLAMTYNVKPGDLMSFTSTFASKALTFSAKGTDEENNSAFDVVGQSNNIAGVTTSAIPAEMTTNDIVSQLAQGMTSDLALTYDSGNLTINGKDETGATSNFTSQSNGGSLKVAIDKDRMSYGILGKGVEMKVSGSSIPFPELAAAYDEQAVNLTVPISKSDEAKDFLIETRLEGLTVSDVIWGMIDSGATLPRDPATLIVSLKGKAKPLIDMLAGNTENMPQDRPPFEVETLDIEALQLTVAGAEFKGNGALAFDNSQPPVLGNVAPMPTGKLNLSLVGATTLLGKLQALGLVQQDMVMTFGMMAAMLGKPGAEPDSYTSEVEFVEGGKITVNGAPMPF